MILFETSTSIFELLWDIALALFIFRISFVYFVLSFATGALIAYFRVARLHAINHFSKSQSEAMTLPIFLLFSIIWARFVIVSYVVPRVGGFRLAIGALALGFMLVADFASGFWMYEKGWTEWIWETDFLAAGLGGVVLLLFGLMPLLLMLFESETDEMRRSSHGHDKKPIIAAIPTVTVNGKEGARGKRTQ